MTEQKAAIKAWKRVSLSKTAAADMTPLEEREVEERSLEELDKVSQSKIGAGSVNLKFGARRGTVGSTPYFGGTFS